MFVIAAATEQPGPPAVQTGRGWHLQATTQPVGTQHAAARAVGYASPMVALCGKDLEGWVFFTDQVFAPGCSASCQRCAQLASADGH
jgi:hypothetical protein